MLRDIKRDLKIDNHKRFLSSCHKQKLMLTNQYTIITIMERNSQR